MTANAVKTIVDCYVVSIFIVSSSFAYMIVLSFCQGGLLLNSVFNASLHISFQSKSGSEGVSLNIPFQSKSSTTHFRRRRWRDNCCMMLQLKGDDEPPTKDEIIIFHHIKCIYQEAILTFLTFQQRSLWLLPNQYQCGKCRLLQLLQGCSHVDAGENNHFHLQKM